MVMDWPMQADGHSMWYGGCLEETMRTARNYYDHNFALPAVSVIMTGVNSPTISLPDCVRPLV
jgi:hypothetical protein